VDLIDQYNNHVGGLEAFPSIAHGMLAWPNGRREARDDRLDAGIG